MIPVVLNSTQLNPPLYSTQLKVIRWGPDSSYPRNTVSYSNTFIPSFLVDDFVYYESMNRELQKRLIYECRCDERLKTKAEESTRLVYTWFLGKLEHLQIETRLIDEMFASVMGECVFLKWYAPHQYLRWYLTLQPFWCSLTVVYYETMKRKLI